MGRRRPDGRVRALWVIAGLPAFAVGGSVMAVMGEVVGEALGGPVVHELGHAVGTVLLLWLLAGTGWGLLRGQVSWATRWAVATAAGSAVGLALFLLWLFLLTGSLLTIALTLHLPLLGAAVAQGIGLRGHVHDAVRWAAAWYLAVLFGVGVAWFAGGGVDGASVYPYPVLEQSIAYFWNRMPPHLAGGVVYAAWTALAVPLGARAREDEP